MSAEVSLLHLQKEGSLCTAKTKMPFKDLPVVHHEKPVNLSVEDTASLLEYRSRFGRCVRQRTVRGDTTKERPGNLPQYMYKRTIDVDASQI